MAKPVPEHINFSEEEENVIQLWKKLDAFKTSMKQSKGKPRFTFYDGPPFATGLPHYGHILAGTIKDIITRYAHQSGYHVERRFGWDCHGLPVEYEVDKTLNIKGPADVEKMGIEKYNNECRKIVMRYAKEWEDIVGRMGRWIDFDNDYKTLYPWFMESIWWVFKQLFNKGLVYKGVKVMPYSTACSTPLSNFESGQNYKEVVDPAVIVSFPLDESPDVSMIAWTTTPWTLPSNLALCVNSNLEYVKVKDNTTQKLYVMMEARLDALFKKPEEYIIIERFKGETLKGKKYAPLFPYFSELKERGAFEILCDNYVTEESGTGVVHQAPYFGEDDYRVCLSHGVITKDQDMVCPLDASGCFTDPVVDFKGQYVKDADKNIIKHLKSAGRLVHQSSTKHSYPFCWRSETPLIYRAVPSWFIRVEHMTEKLLQTNQETYWVPEFVKEKRFANWLRDAHDWAVSRNRYWGTPIPLWVSKDGEEIVCVGSIQEIEELTGQKVEDLHRENIDCLVIPSKCGKGALRRVQEVFDCWFESGSMPYAQVHYPFEHKKEFEESFPADFIAEGVDQTRGWFYTLLVVSTALFGKPPFKNLIVNGLVLASDGQKMSKRKKNYPDPVDIVKKYGADALRLYLINSPVVRAESLRFREEGVRDILKDVFLPWYNAYRFLIQNVELYEKESGMKFRYDEMKRKVSNNIMDQWIVSFTQSLVLFVKNEMAAYRLYTVLPRLVKFVDQLTNWYVRMNRKRLKGEGGHDDCCTALDSLFIVVYTMIRMMGPFTPFLTELMYQNLRHLVADYADREDTGSIHYLPFPQPEEELINRQVERRVTRMQTVVEAGRLVRDRKTLPLKYPLPELVVIHKDADYLEDVKSLEKYIKEEVNIKSLTVTTDKEKYGVQMRAEPDIKALGLRLRASSKAVGKAVRDLTDVQLETFLEGGKLTVAGEELQEGEVRIMYSFTGEKSKELAERYEAHAQGEVLILLDVTPDQSMVDEGNAREVINRIQKLRKKAHLVPSDPVVIYLTIQPPGHQMETVIQNHREFIENTIKAPLFTEHATCNSEVIIQETQELKGASLEMVIVKGGMDETPADSPENQTSQFSSTNGLPFCKYINIELCDSEPRMGATSCKATVFLENPVGDFQLTFSELVKQVQVVFGLQGRRVLLTPSRDKKKVFTNLTKDDVQKLHSQTLYAYVE
ncbi:isoleucyl-tRNA synthetase [Tachypleus tridentatus]|uniref:isoleucyl-tRNA synthetase n=1 Tax=Tachypleus tridentatus TaxID=6853 RepID=UPI003FD1633C